jgi:hypothetical protein
VIVLGLILIVLAVAAGALLFVATQPLTEPVELEAVGVQASVLPLVLLVAGATVMLLLWLGLVMIRGSVRRKTRRRREAKELERQAEREAEARQAAEARAEEARAAQHRASEERAAEERAADERATTTVPAARFADTRSRPGDGWTDETPPGRHAATTTATPADEATTRTDEATPTPADRLMGRDHRETPRS